MSGTPLRLGLVAALGLLLAVGLFGWRELRRGHPSPPALTAAPNPVPAGAGVGNTTITWNTGDGSIGQVYVSENGGPETLFTEGVSGSLAAPWIRSGTSYEFRLYSGRDRAKALAAQTVIGQ